MGIGKYPFQESVALGVARQFHKDQNTIRNIIAPTKDFQYQLQKRNQPSDVMRQFDRKSSLYELIKDLDPLNDYRDALKKSASLVEKNNVWKAALESQKNSELPAAIQDSLKGINLNNSLVKMLSESHPGSRLRDILSSLENELAYLGEYELAEQEGIVGNEEPQIILPDAVAESLASVNFLPITVYQKILDDPSMMRKVSPRDFEYFVAELIEKLGFIDVDVTPRSNDGGRDIVATKIVNDIRMLFAFECKQYSPKRKIQLDTMRALLGAVSHASTKANIGVLVTTSYFTRGAKNMIMSEALIDGKDFHDLVGWIKQVINQ